MIIWSDRNVPFLIQYATDFIFVIVLMGVGAWLEDIGGKKDLMDGFLSPLPLGLCGIVFVIFERLPA